MMLIVISNLDIIASLVLALGIYRGFSNIRCMPVY